MNTSPRKETSGFALIKPTVALKESFLLGLREFQVEGLPWYLSLDAPAIEADFASYVDCESSDDHRHPEHDVLQTVFWGVWSGRFAGKISIRHDLTEQLRVMGGHIGYDTCPSFRGQGIATAMLEAALPFAKKMGLSKVLLTCDDTSVASIKVIEKNGGALQETRELPGSHTMKRYYWISL